MSNVWGRLRRQNSCCFSPLSHTSSYPSSPLFLNVTSPLSLPLFPLLFMPTHASSLPHIFSLSPLSVTTFSFTLICTFFLLPFLLLYKVPFFKFLTLHVHVDIRFGLKIKLLKLNATAYINILERIDISVQLEGGLPSGSNSRGWDNWVWRGCLPSKPNCELVPEQRSLIAKGSAYQSTFGRSRIHM